MSYFKEMIKGERIPDAYNKWKNYRRWVTDYILGNVDANICTELNSPKRKKVMAIWGVGAACDIDLKQLAGEFYLVLIDRDLEAVNEAVLRYGLEKTSYTIADIGFWKVMDEHCEMFEAILRDGEDVEHIQSLMEKILDDNDTRYLAEHEDIFDCSVAIGLHSQLNSRLAALLYRYRENYTEDELKSVMAAISGMNTVAIERLNDYIYKSTAGRIIYGYELEIFSDMETAKKRALECEKAGYSLTAKEEYIQGVAQLMADLSCHVGCDVELLNRKFAVWPFDTNGGSKNYLMEFITLRKI
jgi:hypothetical protein